MGSTFVRLVMHSLGNRRHVVYVLYENHSHIGIGIDMAKGQSNRPVIKMRSTAGTGYTYVTRKSRRNTPDRLTLQKYDPIAQRHVEFREER